MNALLNLVVVYMLAKAAADKTEPAVNKIID
jgi:hypothetical protein